MPAVAMVAGLDELGCSVVGVPNGAMGSVLTIDPASGRPAWLPSVSSGPVTLTATLSQGRLTVTVNGATVTVKLHGELVADAFGAPLGYLLPR